MFDATLYIDYRNVIEITNIEGLRVSALSSFHFISNLSIVSILLNCINVFFFTLYNDTLPWSSRNKASLDQTWADLIKQNCNMFK